MQVKDTSLRIFFNVTFTCPIKKELDRYLLYCLPYLCKRNHLMIFFCSLLLICLRVFNYMYTDIRTLQTFLSTRDFNYFFPDSFIRERSSTNNLQNNCTVIFLHEKFQYLAYHSIGFYLYLSKHFVL